MSIDNWIKVVSLVVDLFKTIIPFGFLFTIFWIFRKELKALIKNGGWKVSAPGILIETALMQGEISINEKKQIEILSKELDTTRKAQEKLEKLQDYTSRDKDTYFLGYHFEKTYRLIFPSQMTILIAIQNLHEITEALASILFLQTIWAQNLNVSYEQFMGFLIASGLILEDKVNKKFTLTPLGNLFLQYLVQNNIPNKLPANDVIIPTTS